MDTHFRQLTIGAPSVSHHKTSCTYSNTTTKGAMTLNTDGDVKVQDYYINLNIFTKSSRDGGGGAPVCNMLSDALPRPSFWQQQQQNDL